jgi:enoyl-CoA hydratase/carnithine racemase
MAAIKGNAHGMLLCGGSKFFSIGLDLPALLKLDRTAMHHFFEDFNGLCLALFTASFPTACALAGHAVAGGNILALTCDYRYASSEKKIGLNELKLGVPVPYLADQILRHTIGNRHATHMMYDGELRSFAEAQKIGLIDEICPPEKLEAMALEMLRGVASLPEPAFSETKANRVEDIAARYKNNHRAKNDRFLDCWFSDPVQQILHEAARKF